MHLSEILIVIAVCGLVGAHLFVISRWLRNETNPPADAVEADRESVEHGGLTGGIRMREKHA
jgi:hypothetical protein